MAEAAGNTQNSPLMGSLREKGGQHPILEVYYFHISQYVCEPLVPLSFVSNFLSGALDIRMNRSTLDRMRKSPVQIFRPH